MAEQVPKSKPPGGQFCVAGAPNNKSCTNNQHMEGISLHRFPKDPTVKKQWVDFVRRHRKEWQPEKYSVLCSAHFEDSCYTKNRQIAASLGIKNILDKKAVPTIDTAGTPEEPEIPSYRTRRQVSLLLLYNVFEFSDLFLIPSVDTNFDTKLHTKPNEFINKNPVAIRNSKCKIKYNKSNEIKSSVFHQIRRSALAEEAEKISTEPTASESGQPDETSSPPPCDKCSELSKELKRARTKLSYHRKKKEELQTLLNESNVSKRIIIFGKLQSMHCLEHNS